MRISRSVQQFLIDFLRKLGLNSFQPVLAVNKVLKEEPATWKISTAPIMITIPGTFERTFCFPIVNCHEADAFYEMIIGNDVEPYFFDVALEKGMGKRNERQSATPGPSYQENVSYMGHNIRLLKIREIKGFENFMELPCHNSTAVFRLAMNKTTRQLIVMYRDNNRVYCYSNLTKALEKAIQDGGVEDSLGATMHLVQDACPCREIDSFPENALWVSF